MLGIILVIVVLYLAVGLFVGAILEGSGFVNTHDAADVAAVLIGYPAFLLVLLLRGIRNTFEAFLDMLAGL